MSAVTKCPRCEGQRYDVGSCGLCGNTGHLDANGDPAWSLLPPAGPNDWEPCPRCSNMDGGCPFCGHGMIPKVGFNWPTGGREPSYTCPCGYSGPEECNGCPGGCKRRPAGVTGWDHIDRAGGR